MLKVVPKSTLKETLLLVPYIAPTVIKNITPKVKTDSNQEQNTQRGAESTIGSNTGGSAEHNLTETKNTRCKSG